MNLIKNRNILSVFKLSHVELFKYTKFKSTIIFFAIIICFFELIGIGMIFPIISLLFNLETDNSIYVQLNNFFYKNNISNNIVLLSFILIVALKSIIYLSYKYLTTISSNNVLYEVRKKVLAKTYKEDFAFVSENLSKIVNVLNQQSTHISSAVTNQYNIIINFAKLLSLVILFLFVSYKFFFVIFITSIIVLFFFKKFIFKAKEYGKNLAILQEQYFSQTSNLFRNYQYIKLSNKFSWNLIKLFKIIIKYNVNNLKFVLINRGTQIFVEPIILTLLIANLYIAVNYFSIDLASLTLLFAALFKIYGALLKLIENIQSYKKDFESFKYFKNFDNIIKNNFDNTKNRIVFSSLKDSIKCVNLNFSVSKFKILNNKSLEIKKNNFTLLKGKSGSGKSTLLNCLSGLYKIEDSQIFYDSFDINKINLFTLRKKLGYVFQENFFFKGTILENITYKKKDKYNNSKIQEYVKLLDLNKIIIQNKEIDENCSNISIGERQRLGILRELLKKPEIIFLDEVTSSVDNNSANIIVNFFKKLKNESTIFCVSHQADFDEIADKIYYF